MIVAGKEWGETRPLLKTSLVEAHWIVATAGYRCSKHLHNFKWNAFVLVKGRLFIDVWKNDYPLTDTTLLDKPGQVCLVKPGEKHLFWTDYTSGAEAIELYYPETLSEDIVRDDCGGAIDEGRASR